MKSFILSIFLFSAVPCFSIDFNGGSASQAKDTATGSSTTIDYSHHEVHEGDHYCITGSTSVTNGQVVEFIIKTPDTTKWAHMVWDYSGNTSVFTHVAYEGVTISTENATAITPLNNNRNSSNTSGLQVWVSTGTGVTSSTILDGPFTIGSSGNPQSRVGGSQSHEQERILKQNTWYVWRFTNGADTQVINFRANWYEHTDR